MFEIDKCKVALTVNKDLLKNGLETKGKILATVSKFALFCANLKEKREDAEKELEILSETFRPLNDSVIRFGRSVVELHHKLEVYEHEQVKHVRSLKELQTHLIPKVEILQQAYKELEAILATPEMSTVDAMEELAVRLKTHIEITKILLET